MKKSTLRHSLDNVFLGGIAQSSMDTIATGTILTAYAIGLGAGNVAIGILCAIPFLGNLIHIFVSYLLENGYSVKKLSVISAFVSRPFYLLSAGLAFFCGQRWTVYALIVFLLLAYLIGNISGGAWRPWMKELVPNSLMGRFFAHRFKWMMVAKIVFTGVAYIILKIFQMKYPEQEIYSYAILLCIAFIIGIYGAYTFTQVQNINLIFSSSRTFIQKIYYSFKNKKFVQMMVALGSLNFAVCFVSPFLTVFMLKRLNIAMSSIIFLTIISQLTYTFIVKKMGKYADEFGHHYLLFYSFPVFILSIVGFVILNALDLSYVCNYLGLFLIHCFMGIGNAGIALGTNNLSLIYVPKQSCSVYLAVNGAFIALMSGLGSIIGGLSMSGYEYVQNNYLILNLNWLLFFATSIILCLLAMIQFKYLKKSLD